MENSEIPASSLFNSQNPPPAEKSKTWVLVIIGVVILAAFILGIYFLAVSEVETTAHIRDIFIILLTLEFVIIGVALVVLIVQLAILTNLLQNEIKPIIYSTSETVNTLRGTVIFLSDNLTEPVIKLNEYLAAAKKFFDLIRPIK